MTIHMLHIFACLLCTHATRSSISCSQQRIITGVSTVLNCTYIGEKPTGIFFDRLENSTGASLTLCDSDNACCHPCIVPNCTICISPGIIGTSYMLSFNVSVTPSSSMFGVYRISVDIRNNRTLVYDIEALCDMHCVSSSTCEAPLVMRCTLPITPMKIIEPHWEWIDDDAERSVTSAHVTRVSNTGNHTEYSAYLTDLKESRMYMCELRYECDRGWTLKERPDDVSRYCVLASSRIFVQRPECEMLITVGPQWTFIILFPFIVVFVCYIYRWINFKCAKAARMRI